MDEKDVLRIGRVEDKIRLYEPLLASLHGLVSIPDEVGKIYNELGILKDSRIEVREKLATLFKMQDRVYKEIIEKLEDSAGDMEKELEKFPIKDIIQRLGGVEQSIKAAVPFERRLKVAEDTIESFKLKGWDLLLRIIPWIIAAVASMYAVLE